MALSANTNIDRYIDQQLRSLKVKQSAHVYRGAMVGLDRSGGYVRPLTAGDLFVGIAYGESDNSSGADGDREATVFTQGDFEMALAGAAKTHIGRPVFASDDATLSLVGDGNSYVGTIVDVPAGGRIILRIDPLRRNTRHVSVPLESSTASASSNPVATFGSAIVVLSVRVWFETKPDAGALDVGTDPTDPDEIVDSFDLTTLTNGVAASVSLAGSSVAAGTRIWAKVGQATAQAGVAGGLTLEYVPLP